MSSRLKRRWHDKMWPRLTARCQFCGEFYSKRLMHRHRICRMLLDQEAAGF